MALYGLHSKDSYQIRMVARLFLPLLRVAIRVFYRTMAIQFYPTLDHTIHLRRTHILKRGTDADCIVECLSNFIFGA